MITNLWEVLDRMKNKKGLTWLKKLGISLALLTVISLATTYFVGNYFVDYALVPNQGGQDRQVDQETKPGQTKSAVQEINANKAQAKADAKAWLDQVGDKKEAVSIRSQDGLTLSGNLFHNDSDQHKYALIVHGYQGQEADSYDIAPAFYQKGYQVLTISLRAHAPSQGQYIGMGYLDSQDLLEWVQWLIDRDSQAKIVLHGTSMGSATVLMASDKLPAAVKAVVADCGYSSIWDIFASELDKRFNLPTFPVLYMANTMARLRAGYDLREGNTVEYVAQSSLPILFIHGAADDFVPVSMARELYDAKSKGPKELYIVPEAGHAEAKYKEPTTYYQKIFQFIQDYGDENKE